MVIRNPNVYHFWKFFLCGGFYGWSNSVTFSYSPGKVGLGAESEIRLTSREPTRRNRPIRFISPHLRVSLLNRNLILKLARQVKVKISQNIRISQKSLAHILGWFLSDLSRSSGVKCLEVDANIWSVNVTWPPLLSSPGWRVRGKRKFLLTLVYMGGGGGGKFAPQAVFCCS